MREDFPKSVSRRLFLPRHIVRARTFRVVVPAISAGIVAGNRCSSVGRVNRRDRGPQWPHGAEIETSPISSSGTGPAIIAFIAHHPLRSDTSASAIQFPEYRQEVQSLGNPPIHWRTPAGAHLIRLITLCFKMKCPIGVRHVWGWAKFNGGAAATLEMITLSRQWRRGARTERRRGQVRITVLRYGMAIRLPIPVRDTGVSPAAQSGRAAKQDTIPGKVKTENRAVEQHNAEEN